MLAAFVLCAVLVAAPEGGPTKLVLKNGTVYTLKEPPKISGGRIVFETTDGKIFSISESEVATIGMAPTPTPTPRYNIEDSRALGGIARQERSKSGKSAEVAPRPTHRPTKTPRPTRTPVPHRRSPTPTPRPR